MTRYFDNSMRLFYISSCVAMIAGVCFALAKMDIYKFIFLHIAPAFAYSGFLLTALKSWHNYTKSLFLVQITFYFTILLALILSFFALNLSYLLLGVFWLSFAIVALFLMIREGNLANISIAFSLFSFFLVEVLLFLNYDEKFSELFLHLNLILLLIVGFKISLVIANNALKEIKDAVFIPNFIDKNLAIFFIFLYMIAFLYDKSVSGYFAIAVGLVVFAKLRELFYLILLKKLYVFIYFLITLFMAIGYFGLGVCELFLTKFRMWMIDFLYLSSVVAMLLFIFNITTLLHSKRELGFTNSTKFGFLTLFLSAILGNFLYLQALLLITSLLICITNIKNIK